MVSRSLCSPPIPARRCRFCTFWLGMDQNSKRRMSKEKSGAILKVIVKHFFVEKEVTSTLVMDSLYSGLKVLEGQYKAKKNNGKHLDVEEQSIPIIRMEKDMFVLVEDVLLLLERAALEQRPPKDEKGPQNRIKKRGKRGIDYRVPSVSIEDARHAKEESVIYELRQRLGSQELTVATILSMQHIWVNLVTDAEKTKGNIDLHASY
nr:MATH domain-containing protein At5g43560 [Ipomoea batatas]